MQNKIMMLVTLAAAMAFSGCARFQTTQQDLSYDKAGTQRTITTKATATTFFAGKTALAKWKASQTDKTQGASVGTLEQQADASTNLTGVVEAVATGITRGLKP
jgi:hypothetical protein